MKLISKNVDKDFRGEITLQPEESEDMWHAYNLIRVEDYVTASTVRKVQTESLSGSSSSSRVHTVLTLAVENVDFDTQACTLRLKGRNTVENPHVKMGAYHTLNLELNRKFTIAKENWDTVDLERVDVACDPAKNADVAAVVMQEGLANICLITSTMTTVRLKVEQRIPKKRKDYKTEYEKALTKFYKNVMQGILKHINFSVVKCVLIASPGFTRYSFHEFLFEEAVKTGNKLLLDNRNKFLTVQSSTGYIHSLKEVLSDPMIATRMADTKAISELRALENFYNVLKTDTSRAFYGVEYVEKADELQAVETLLISDSLFRSSSISERRRYVNLVDSVKDNGGKVLIFSSMHITGEQLRNMSGIAAILRFPLPEIEDQLSTKTSM